MGVCEWEQCGVVVVGGVGVVADWIGCEVHGDGRVVGGTSGDVVGNSGEVGVESGGVGGKSGVVVVRGRWGRGCYELPDSVVVGPNGAL